MNPEILESIEREMATARVAIAESNEGKARVCARRAVVVAVQGSNKTDEVKQWNSTMALEHLLIRGNYPDEVASAAKRLQGGLRSKLEGKMYSQNPVEDAEIIIRYFVDLLY